MCNAYSIEGINADNTAHRCTNILGNSPTSSTRVWISGFLSTCMKLVKDKFNLLSHKYYLEVNKLTSMEYFVYRKFDSEIVLINDTWNLSLMVDIQIR